MNGETLYFNSWFSATEDGITYRYSKHVFIGSERLVTRVRQERDYNWDSEDVTTYYYHPDHLGSVSVVSNHKGVPYERVEYLPFGEVWIEDVDAATRYIPFRFTSKELDRETGLYYYGARYYEPKVSRWMSADPAGFALINPNRGGYSVIEATNWYAYVSNNPVKYVDPEGEEATAALGGLAATGAALTAIPDPFTTIIGLLILAGVATWAALEILEIADTIDDTNSTDDTEKQKPIIAGALGDASASPGGMEPNQDPDDDEPDGKNFPEDPDDFNPENTTRKDYKGGDIKKWHDNNTGKSRYEWHKDSQSGGHYHKNAPDGKGHLPHPETGNEHIGPGDKIF